jgi:hypothetical protein
MGKSRSYNVIPQAALSPQDVGDRGSRGRDCVGQPRHGLGANLRIASLLQHSGRVRHLHRPDTDRRAPERMCKTRKPGGLTVLHAFAEQRRLGIKQSKQFACKAVVAERHALQVDKIEDWRGAGLRRVVAWQRLPHFGLSELARPVSGHCLNLP